jgi:hypothetical protein
MRANTSAISAISTTTEHQHTSNRPDSSVVEFLLWVLSF